MQQTFTIQADTVLYFMYTTQNTKANLKYKYKICMIRNIVIEAETYVFQKHPSFTIQYKFKYRDTER